MSMKLKDISSDSVGEVFKSAAGPAGEVTAWAVLAGMVGMLLLAAASVVMFCVAAPILIPVVIVWGGYKILTDWDK